MWQALVGLVGCDDCVGLFAGRMAFGTFYTAGETLAVPGRGAGGKLVVWARSVLFGRLAGSPPADYKSAIPGRRSQFGAPIGLAILSWVVDLPVAGFVGADSLQFA